MHTILCNFEVQTDHRIEARWSNLEQEKKKDSVISKILQYQETTTWNWK